jgi:hypothetical protein
MCSIIRAKGEPLENGYIGRYMMAKRLYFPDCHGLVPRMGLGIRRSSDLGLSRSLERRNFPCAERTQETTSIHAYSRGNLPRRRRSRD